MVGGYGKGSTDIIAAVSQIFTLGIMAILRRSASHCWKKSAYSLPIARLLPIFL